MALLAQLFSATIGKWQPDMAAESGATEIAKISPYRAKLIAARMSGSDEIIDNGEGAQATDMISELFVLARQQHLPVDIYSGSLHSAVFVPITALLKDYLSDDKAKLRVLTDTPPAELAGNAFSDTVSQHQKAQIFRYPLNAVNMLHFMLVGDRAYRLETDHHRFVASGCFNDTLGIMTKLLRSRFEAAWNLVPAV